MSLFITSLNSGSNGNCYYVGNVKEAILVDAGISCREIEKRMRRLGLSMQKIKAVFVSHEHIDHVKGICSLIKKYQIPVYITHPTLIACGFSIEENLVKPFSTDAPVNIGDLTITAFSKLHDACDPCSFVVEYQQIKVGVFTDIGVACKNLISQFQQCNAAFLEANFDEEMLDKGNYPYFLKRRITGGNGHLSNKQALELFTQYRPSFMSHLILSHLSKNNNCPKLVQQLFNEQAGGVKMIVASRYEETAVYHIHSVARLRPVTAKTISPAQLAFAFA
ncbi:MAG: MBL fold metallo-hydrolase [Bacteroidota bacterium]|nr:MBL fold metallo-hydrolase [Bacteroidota bacterium]